MRRVRWLAGLAALLMALTGVAVAQDQSDLSDVQRRLDRISSEISGAEAAASAAGQELADADARLAEVEAIVNEVAADISAQESRVADAEAELERLRSEFARVQEAFRDRTVELFKRSYGSDLDLVLSAGDLQEAIDRSTLLEAVNRSDQATLEQVEAAEGQVRTQQLFLDGELERLQVLRQEQEAVLAQVAAIRESKALAAASARARVTELAHQQDSLEAEEARIQRIIEQNAAPPPTVSPPSTSGYVWPACGTVTSEYGRRWGRLHAGLDIDDNCSSAIVAARSGVVIQAGWSGGYGQLTVIDHGDGVTTAYAHQSAMAVSVGQSVSRGQRIGTIGTTGNSTGTHLHFEVRVNGSAQNPRRFLP